MFQLVPILVLAILSTLGVTGYIVVQQNKQIGSLSNQVKTLQVSPTASPSPTITPTSEPTPTPTKKPYVKPTYAPGEAPAQELSDKQKALMEIDALISAYQKNVDAFFARQSELLKQGYPAMYMDAIQQEQDEIRRLQYQRRQIMAE